MTSLKSCALTRRDRTRGRSQVVRGGGGGGRGRGRESMWCTAIWTTNLGPVPKNRGVAALYKHAGHEPARLKNKLVCWVGRRVRWMADRCPTGIGRTKQESTECG